MPTMEANLVARRAEALIILHLTRRSDVDIASVQNGAYDLLATVCRNRKREANLFGIQVDGILPETVDSEFARSARNGRKKPTRCKPPSALFPVCKMAVDVVSNEINWHWLLEPIVDETGKHLRANHDTSLMPLTNEAVNAIVESVNRWYDAG